jgi:hypothetical protein
MSVATRPADIKSKNAKKSVIIGSSKLHQSPQPGVRQQHNNNTFKSPQQKQSSKVTNSINISNANSPLPNPVYDKSTLSTQRTQNKTEAKPTPTPKGKISNAKARAVPNQ